MIWPIFLFRDIIFHIVRLGDMKNIIASNFCQNLPKLHLYAAIVGPHGRIAKCVYHMKTLL